MTGFAADAGLDLRAFPFACMLAEAVLGETEAVVPLKRAGVITLPDLRALARVATFRGPLRRGLSAGCERSDLSAVVMGELVARASGRMAVLVATRPHVETDAVALLVAGAVWHRRLLRLALRAERAHARNALGAETTRIATQEVPTLHPSLAFLDAGDEAWATMMRADEADGRRAATGYGYDVLLSCLDAASPPLGDFARRRLGLDSHGVPPIAPALEAHLVKFVSRRVPAWSAIIG